MISRKLGQHVIAMFHGRSQPRKCEQLRWMQIFLPAWMVLRLWKSHCLRWLSSSSIPQQSGHGQVSQSILKHRGWRLSWYQAILYLEFQNNLKGVQAINLTLYIHPLTLKCIGSAKLAKVIFCRSTCWSTTKMQLAAQACSQRPVLL